MSLLMPHPDDLVASYSFALDPQRIAQHPLDHRDGSRLMHVRGGEPDHRSFDHLPELLDEGDLLVVNDTRVLPARLTARKDTGGVVRLLLTAPLQDGAWSALVRPSAKLRPGTTVRLEHRASGEVGPSIVIGEMQGGGQRRIEGVPADALERFGEMPLPPYIDRSDGPCGSDFERYQTVYAAHTGAVAAPTAGLHFTDALLERLAARGVRVARVTLHVGLGTFAPLRQTRVKDIELHAEPWRVPPETAHAVTTTLEAGRRVVAVGTTSCRALESWHRAGRPTDGMFRDTRLFLHPGDRPQLPLSLLTNFHLPGSSLVMLVASFLSRPRVLELYDLAQTNGYRFYSYGDAMLLV